MKRTLLISALALASCSTANISPEPPVENGMVSIAFLKTLWKGAPVKITAELRISGNVVSSDAAQNFYKTLVIDDGTGGIELKLDLEDIFRRYLIRSCVEVHCNGLWLGSYGGTLQLGSEPYGDLQAQYIPESEIPLHCFTAGIPEEPVVPRRLDFQSIAASHISTYVSFDGVQFIDEETGLSWADTDSGEETSGTGTDRLLVDPSGDTLAVRTSRYALFAHKILPAGNGYIEGVLNYFNGSFRLILCDDQKAVMENPRFGAAGGR